MPEDPVFTRSTSKVWANWWRWGAERGRRGRPDVVLSICGEHGGSRSAIAFCRDHKFDYVSCSPFRVPGARLMAAQMALKDKITKP